MDGHCTHHDTDVTSTTRLFESSVLHCLSSPLNQLLLNKYESYSYSLKNVRSKEIMHIIELFWYSLAKIYLHQQGIVILDAIMSQFSTILRPK